VVEMKRVDAFIKGNDYVTLTDMGEIIEVQYLERMNHSISIKKVSKTKYVDLVTGELKEFNLSENRSQNVNSLRQTFKKLGYLVNNNFKGGKNELWGTLTYAENMQDLKQVYSDFDKFLKRFKYYCKKTYGEKGHFDYIKVLEPQERGSWHIHFLIKFPNMKKIFIENKRLAELWSHGFVNVKNINRTDNLGAYLCAYLSNLPLQESDWTEDDRKYYKDLMFAPGVEGIEQTKTDKDKSVVKGGRLHLYPVGMNIFSKSKGIEYPERRITKYDAVRKRLGFTDENLTLRKSVRITDDSYDYSNTIVIEQYNKRVQDNTSYLAQVKQYWQYVEDMRRDPFAIDEQFKKNIEQEFYNLEHRFEIAEQKREEILQKKNQKVS